MKLVTPSLFSTLLEKAAASPRRRSNFNLHEQSQDPIQRLFIAAKSDSYFRAHRHPDKWEFSIVVRGAFDVLTFDEVGVVTQRIRVGPDAEVYGFELPPNTFHAWVPVADDSVFFEVKQGPYDVVTAAQFAPWAPAESATEVPAFVQKLALAKIGESVA
ncbi:MAG: cupin fold metalloprotein WbuC family [Verrucomicrobiaceae bacterium]|nr:cupin fold metalloprotein WbuC family [Verrucomicrobiaceae bacterium]